MSNLLYKHRVALIGLLALIGVIAAATQTYYLYNVRPFPADQQQTTIVGSTHFALDSPNGIRVVVRDLQGRAIANSNVTVKLRPNPKDQTIPRSQNERIIYEGKTDASGSVPVSFVLPSDTLGEQTLIVETASAVGADRVEQKITVQRNYKVLVTSDKPLYQPGQTMHLRALALNAFDRKPVAATSSLEFLIEDPKGNKVFRKSVPLSPFGIASLDFALADPVNAGDYKISATVGDSKSEKIVNVRPYVLPKFKANIETERNWYLSGERVSGRVRADYFFGKPVAQGKVELKGFIYDGQRMDVAHLRGQTNEEGIYAFDFVLPNYFAGGVGASSAQRADFALELSLTDQADHTEQAVQLVTLARSPIVIEAVAESGQLVTGIENIIYVMTTTPDGAPVESELTLSASYITQSIKMRTGKYGLAEVRLTPSGGSNDLYITARDQQGRSAAYSAQFQLDSWTQRILLRPNRAAYLVGETMQLDMYAAGDVPLIYLDVVREGQTRVVGAFKVVNGRAQAKLDLSPELVGAVQLHAYYVPSDGRLVRDTRLVVVEPSNDLQVAAAADKPSYRPGDNARVSFNVTNSAGQGVPSALGVNIVDESVFALAEQDASFAKLYFLMQKELLDPKFRLKGFEVPALFVQAQPAALRASQDQSAHAAWANAPSTNYDLNVNTATGKKEIIERERRTAFVMQEEKLSVALIVLPWAFGCLIVVGLARKGVLGGALSSAFIAGLVFSAVFPFVIVLLLFMGNTPLVPILLVVGAIGWVVAFVTLLEFAIHRSERWLQVVLVLLGMYFAFLGLMAYASSFVGSTFTLNQLAPIFLAFVIGLAALVVLGFGLLHQDESSAGQAAIWLAFLCIPIAILLASLPFASPFMRALGNPTLYLPTNVLMACGPATTPAPAQPTTRAAAAPMPAPTAAPAAMPQPTRAPAAPAANNPNAPAANSQSAEPPRLRQYFPETLYANPEVITDEQGRATLDIPLADSITTWRMVATANAQNGGIGHTRAALKVFQDFFVDLDLPVALTQNDEISIPVAVYNYLPQAQQVRLQIEPRPWFELQDQAEKSLLIGSNDIEVVYFRIKALQFGVQTLTVNALGAKLSDAIQRQVRVHPDGRLVEKTFNGWLRGDTEASIPIPAQAIAGASRIELKIYPGVMSQLVEGLDAIFRMPNGCFEQTTSTTYPNVLALNYLKQTQQASPQVRAKAEQYIAMGYQRLLTFEVQKGGGFSVFGHPPPVTMLTSKGLLEFSDMAKVYPVDPDLLERTSQWILSQQNPDGSWTGSSAWNYPQAGNGDPFPLTAYVTWALAEASTQSPKLAQINREGLTRAVNYLKTNLQRANDPYMLALAANALVVSDAVTGVNTTGTNLVIQDLLTRLEQIKTVQADAVYWKTQSGTFTGAYGQMGNVETTALAAYALMRGHAYPDTAQRALTYLVQQKDPRGIWASTSATILALRALVESATNGSNVPREGSVHASFNNGRPQTVQIDRSNFDVVQTLTFDNVKQGDNRLFLKVNEGNFLYQITAQYYLPWEVAPQSLDADRLLDVQVNYDRTKLKVNDKVNVDVHVRMTREGKARMAMVDLGVPPGFTVLSEDFDALVKTGTILRYELTGRQIIVYLNEMTQNQFVAFKYRLQAKYALNVKTPSSLTYDYYNPSVGTTRAPVKIVVQ